MHQQITLALSLQEGFQYRVGTIDIVGLNPALESKLRSKIKAGDILNSQLIDDFYQDYKSELPEEVVPSDSAFHTNVKDRTADLLFDFRSCSQLPPNTSSVTIDHDELFAFLLLLSTTTELVVLNLIPQHDPQPDPEFASHGYACLPKTLLHYSAAIKTLHSGSLRAACAPASPQRKRNSGLPCLLNPPSRSASFGPSSVRANTEQFTRAVARPALLWHQQGKWVLIQ
jgi:hypothetical protein